MVKVNEKNPVVSKQMKFVLDLGIAYDDQLIVPKEFVDFLKANFKVNGIKGGLGEDVAITLQKRNVTFTSKRRFRKRYIKYLTKKYLKKFGILEYLRVISTDKNTYRIKFLNSYDNEEEDEN